MAPIRKGDGRTLGGLVLLFAGLAMADPALHEPDVADLPPELARYVAELHIRAVRESDGWYYFDVSPGNPGWARFLGMAR
jgi:hypothetical protein